MHPIERLRYVARAGTLPDSVLVGEAMSGLAAFAHDPRALLVALKGLITRQPDSPGLLSLAAHMVQALEPITAGWEFADAIAGDPTLSIAETIAITEAGGTDVIDSIASGAISSDESKVIVRCPIGTRAWIENARNAGRSVVVVTPLGTCLPHLLWGRFVQASPVGNDEGHGSHGHYEDIALETFDDVIGPNGIVPTGAWSPDSPNVAEVSRF